LHAGNAEAIWAASAFILRGMAADEQRREPLSPQQYALGCGYCTDSMRSLEPEPHGKAADRRRSAAAKTHEL
jgi:hypothetical protein